MTLAHITALEGAAAAAPAAAEESLSAAAVAAAVRGFCSGEENKPTLIHRVCRHAYPRQFTITPGVSTVPAEEREGTAPLDH